MLGTRHRFPARRSDRLRQPAADAPAADRCLRAHRQAGRCWPSRPAMPRRSFRRRHRVAAMLIGGRLLCRGFSSARSCSISGSAIRTPTPRCGPVCCGDRHRRRLYAAGRHRRHRAEARNRRIRRRSTMGATWLAFCCSRRSLCLTSATLSMGGLSAAWCRQPPRSGERVGFHGGSGTPSACWWCCR